MPLRNIFDRFKPIPEPMSPTAPRGSIGAVDTDDPDLDYETEDEGIERTTSNIQLELDRGTGRLDHPNIGYRGYEKYRTMRQDPTIALGRQMAAAPILAAAWTVEGDDEEQVEYVKHQLLPWRSLLMRTAVFGYIDFGWKGYEYTLAPYDVEEVEEDGFGEEQVVGTVVETGISAVRPLKNDYTWALYDIKGKLLGLENEDLYSGEELVIEEGRALFINFDEEGLGEYGLPLMQNALQPYEEWLEANKAAARYDKKIAGEHWIVYYPIGRTKAEFMKDKAGTDGLVSNDQIAAEILNQLCASGSASIPVHIDQIVSNLQGGSDTGWKIELLSSAGLQHTFVDRLSYLDSQKVRAMLMPERAILEGQFGTKAEAETHADMALVIRQLQHEHITEQINKQVVDDLLQENFNAKPNSARLVAMPLSDEKQALYKELFMKLVDHPESSTQVLEGIDFDELRESLSIPFDPMAIDADVAPMLGDPLMQPPVPGQSPIQPRVATAGPMVPGGFGGAPRGEDPLA